VAVLGGGVRNVDGQESRRQRVSRKYREGTVKKKNIEKMKDRIGNTNVDVGHESYAWCERGDTEQKK